ncbi:MAG: septum formation initiator family protein [Proteobacteria bacterium]|nr:septum formation initiator family protein [Pseudomonadota bacterium]
MKWFAAALVGALLLLQYRIWFSGDGIGEVLRLRTAVAGQEAENQRLSERNRQLAAEVRDLKQGYAALEERARTDLGMIGRNETFFQVATGASAAPTAPGTEAGGIAPVAPMPASGPATHTASR